MDNRMIGLVQEGRKALGRKLLAALVLIGCIGIGSPLEAKEWVNRMFTGSLTHDFGIVARGATAEYRFALENPYMEDVHISGVRSSCGCTIPRATKTVLKTYETAEIVAEVNTRQFKDQREATITVTFDQPYPAEIQLHVSAFIRGDVVFEPGSLQFGTAVAGRSMTKQALVSYAGRKDWQIVNATPTAAFLDCKIAEQAREIDANLGATKVDYDLDVTLKDNAPTGYFKEQIILRTNDPNPQTAQVAMTVEGLVSAPLTINPSAVHLGIVRPGQTVDRNLVIRGNRPFKVLRADGPDDRFSFSASPQAKSVHLIAMKFVADGKPGKILGKIAIATNLDDGVVEAAVDGQIAADKPPKAGDSSWTPATTPLSPKKTLSAPTVKLIDEKAAAKRPAAKPSTPPADDRADDGLYKKTPRRASADKADRQGS
jgi:hypothetical protein